MKRYLLLFVGIALVTWSCSGNQAENGGVDKGGFDSPQIGGGAVEVPEVVNEKHEHHHEHDHAHHDSFPEEHTEKEDANAHMHQTQFGDLVGFFESTDREAWQKPSAVLELLGDLEGKKVMDLGAGTGYFAFRLLEAGAQVIAADVDNRFIEFMQNRKDSLGIKPEDFEIRKVFFDDPLLEEQEADVFFTVDTYHHIENRQDYLKKVFEGLKLDGTIMVVDFKAKETPHGPPARIRISGPACVKELESIGFSELILDTNTLPEQYIVYGIKAH